jgi:predicted dehydrogenase
MNLKTTVTMATMLTTMGAAAADYSVQLLTLDPGHFHAGLVQKLMYPQVDPIVRVYSPGGPDLNDHLQRVESFNTRADKPTHWETKTYVGPDFLKRMVGDRAGNVVVISGNNLRKTEYIDRSIAAGFNVLADKPMAITPEGFKLLRKDFDKARKKNVLLYDIMTERFEITTILQRELAQRPEVFGQFEPGTPDRPAVYTESVHHYSKEVAGKPLVRPAWFFDVKQQGEAIPDVGTHLVDLVQWGCFPGQTLDWRKDVKVLAARRWATPVSPAQFKKATGLDSYPAYLEPEVDAQGILQVYSCGEVTWLLKGIHAQVKVIWNFEAPPGAKDMHSAIMRGTKADLLIKQGAEQKYAPTLYVQAKSGVAAAEFEKNLKSAVESISASYPGIGVQRAGELWQISIPEKYIVGHEAHFAQVTENYLKFLAQRQLPAWEVPNMITKYFVTTEAYRLSHKQK